MIEQVNNTPRYLLRNVMEKCARLNIPTQAILELTYRCNLHCVHCYVDISEPDELTADEWKNVIDQLKSAGVISLLLTGGEVLLREDFLDILSYAKRSKFFISLATNGALIDSDMAHDIVKLKPSAISISLYGASAMTHEAVTNVSGSFEKTLEGIRALVACGIKPLVQTVVMKSNVNELEHIDRLVTNLGADINIDTVISPTKTGAEFPFRFETTCEELINCGWLPERFSKLSDDGHGLCKAGKSLLSVAPNGDVFPCNVFPIKLGNLRQANIDKIWHLEPCAELRYLRSMRRADLYACEKCELSVYCQRCPGIAYIETGRLDGPSTSACRQAETRRRLYQAAEVRS